MTNHRAPNHLSHESKKIWRDIFREWELDRSQRLLLQTALESYDRLQGARKEIEREGVTYTTPTGQKKPHPALRVEKEARSGFLQSWRMIGLDIEVPGEIGRPPGS